MLKSFAFFASVGQVSTATLCERFRTKCLTNHLNLQLPFLRLEAVIAEVKKCSPLTHDSQINSLLVWKKAVVRYCFSSSLCSLWLSCPVEQRQSITYSLSSWQNVRNVDVKALTIPPLVLCAFSLSILKPTRLTQTQTVEHSSRGYSISGECAFVYLQK